MDIFRSEQFDPEFTTHLNLLLQVDQNRFAYCIYDPKKKETLLLHNKALVLRAGETIDFPRLAGLMAQDDMLFLPFHKILISVSHPAFTLLPAELVEAGNEKEYIKWSHPVQVDDFLISEWWEGKQILSNIPVRQQTKLAELWPAAHITHTIFALLSWTNLFPEGEHILVDVADGYMQLIAWKDGQLQIANRYTYQSKDDFIYFLLLATDQIQFDRETCSIHISGLITRDSAITQDMEKFFNKVLLMSDEQMPLQMQNPPTMPIHTFATLIALSTCV